MTLSKNSVHIKCVSDHVQYTVFHVMPTGHLIYPEIFHSSIWTNRSRGCNGQKYLNWCLPSVQGLLVVGAEFRGVGFHFLRGLFLWIFYCACCTNLDTLSKKKWTTLFCNARSWYYLLNNTKTYN